MGDDDRAQIEAWLTNINTKYGEYVGALVDAGFDDAQACQLLTEQDLKDCGIKPGHAKVIAAVAKRGAGAMTLPSSPRKAGVGASTREIAQMNEDHAQRLAEQYAMLGDNLQSDVAVRLGTMQKEQVPSSSRSGCPGVVSLVLDTLHV